MKSAYREGIAEGEIRGEKKGELKGKLEIARKMRAEGLNSEQRYNRHRYHPENRDEALSIEHGKCIVGLFHRINK